MQYLNKIFLFFILTTFGFLNIVIAQANWTIYNTSNSDIPHNTMRFVTIDNNEVKWVATSLGGLVKIDGTNMNVFNTTNSGLPDNEIRSLTLGINDVKLIGCRFGGLAIYDDLNWTVYNTSNSGLPNNGIFSIALDVNGDKWMGTVGGGIAKFDGTNWTVYNTTNSGLPHNDARSLSIDANNDKWIGTYGGGLAKFDGNSWTIYNTANSDLPNNSIRVILIDSKGNKWIGTLGGGLAKFDGINWTIFNTTNSDIPDNEVLSIAENANGDIWIGTQNGGVAIFDGTIWSFYNTNNSDLPHNNIRSIAFENNGDIWFGTYDGLAVLRINTSNDIGIETIISPADSVCSSAQNTIEVSLKNHGSEFITDFDVTAVISGDFSDSFTSTFTDTLYPDESGNFIIGYFNYPQGGDIELMVYTSLSGDADRNNDTLNIQVYIFSKVSPDIDQGSVFEGNWNSGTETDPDDLCLSNTVSYEFPPPSGFNNNEYGDKWGLTVKMMTIHGHSASNVSINDPTSNNNALLTYTGSTSDIDSVFILTVEYTLNSTQCTDTVSRYVIVKPLPEASFSVNNQCLNSITSFINTSTITSGSIIDYEWDFGDGNSSNNSNPENTYNNAGNYFVSLKATSDALCESVFNIEIKIFDLPLAKFETNDVCAGRKLNLTDQSEGGGLSYYWDFGNNNEDNVVEPEVTYNESGKFDISLIVIDSNGCSDSIVSEVNVFALPDAGFTYTESENIFKFKPNIESYNSYEWVFGDSNISNEVTPEYIFAEEEDFKVSLTVEDSNYCINSLTKEVSAEIEFKFFIPNAFSPNDDKTNDYFEINLNNVLEFNLMILDQWGEIIFTSNDPGFKWDGKFKGELVEEGVYIYYIKFIKYNVKTYRLTGTIHLIR